MNALTFKNQTITPIIINDRPYLGVGQIDLALNYRNGTTCRKVYERHADEFTPEMTFLTDADTKGGKQQIRVFSLRGCHLLAMFSKTPVAKEFRKWVLDILEGKIPLPVAPKNKGGAPLGNQNARKKASLPAPESPLKIATAYEQHAFEDLLRRIVRDEIRAFFNPEKDNASHPSGMPFANWAASIVHAGGGMRSEYDALRQREPDDKINAIRKIINA